MGTVDLPSVFGAGRALTRGVSLEDDCTVKEISAQGKMEVFATVGFKAHWFHCREFVDGGEDGRGCNKSEAGIPALMRGVIPGRLEE